MVRERLIRGLIGWLVLSAVGTVVVALPDEGERIISFSEEHGPSLVDALGVLMLVLGWLLFLVPLWRLRSSIRWRRRLGHVAISAAVLTVWSVVTDTGAWWVLGAAVLVAVQVVAAGSALSHTRRPIHEMLSYRDREAGPRPGGGDDPASCRACVFYAEWQEEGASCLRNGENLRCFRRGLLRAGTPAARKALLRRGSALGDGGLSVPEFV
jgi:hypothetical protein